MYLCDFISDNFSCTCCPFEKRNCCQMDSKKEIIQELQDLQDDIEYALAQLLNN